MSEQTVAQLPAGWHADPYGRYESRYFDGERWSLNVRDKTGGVSREAETVAPPPPPAPAPALTEPPAATPPAAEPLAAEPLAAAPVEQAASDEPSSAAQPPKGPAPAPSGRSRAGLITVLVVLLVAAAAVAALLTR